MKPERVKAQIAVRRRCSWILFVGGIALLAGCARSAPQAAEEPVAKAPVKEEKAVMNELPKTTVNVPAGREVATFAAGCFWCTEAIFTELKGVERVESGYSGGKVANPSYEQVCTGATDHAEAIQITYDPKIISYKQLLEIFLTTHDPTTLNRQGNDVGTQYRSAVFYHNEAQKETAQAVIKEIDGKHLWPDPIVTKVTPFTNFYKAENYHQEYFERNGSAPYCQFVIAPKVAKFRDHYREMLRR
jgi:peptide-methionine (S)-S-oxide reductase